MHKYSTIITNNLPMFLASLKAKYQLYHASNVFFRDLHFGVIAFLESKKIRLTYSSSEDLTREVIRALEASGILRKIDDRSWLLEYPEYRKESTKPVPAEKAAAPAKPAAPSPAN